MHVVVASRNPAKVAAVEEAVQSLFPGASPRVHPLAVPEGPRPYTDQGVLAGARYRATRAREGIPEADFWIGIEAGVHPTPEGAWWMVAWVAVRHASGRTNEARAGAFRLPPTVARALHAGRSLEQALDLLSPSATQRRVQGMVSLLSRGVLLRRHLYTQAVMLALLPWCRPEIWEA